jgi:hypothetical protein
MGYFWTTNPAKQDQPPAVCQRPDTAVFTQPAIEVIAASPSVLASTEPLLNTDTITDKLSQAFSRISDKVSQSFSRLADDPVTVLREQKQLLGVSLCVLGSVLLIRRSKSSLSMKSLDTLRTKSNAHAYYASYMYAYRALGYATGIAVGGTAALGLGVAYTCGINSFDELKVAFRDAVGVEGTEEGQSQAAQGKTKNMVEIDRDAADWAELNAALEEKHTDGPTAVYMKKMFQETFSFK